MKKPEPGRSSNGFVLPQTLMLLFLLCMFCSLQCLQIRTASMLNKADQSMQTDLQVIREARQMAGHSVWAKKCGQSDPPDTKIEMIGEHRVVFINYQTMIQASYTVNEEPRVFRLYYDSGGIIKMEWNQQKSS